MRAIGAHGAARIVVFAQRLHQADGVDGHAGVLQDLAGLVEGELAEGVDAGGDQHDGLAAFDVLHAIGGVGEGVEQVRFGEGRDAQPLHGFLRLALVGGEIGQDLRPHVVGHDGDVVLRLQRLEESVGGLQRLVPGLGPILLEQVAELDDHADGHRRFARGEVGDLLRDVVLEDAEVAAWGCWG